MNGIKCVENHYHEEIILSSRELINLDAQYFDLRVGISKKRVGGLEVFAVKDLYCVDCLGYCESKRAMYSKMIN